MIHTICKYPWISCRWLNDAPIVVNEIVWYMAAFWIKRFSWKNKWPLSSPLYILPPLLVCLRLRICGCAVTPVVLSDVWTDCAWLLNAVYQVAARMSPQFQSPPPDEHLVRVPGWRPARLRTYTDLKHTSRIYVTTIYALFTCRMFTWWRHQIGTFSALLVLCAGNSPVTGEFPSQKPVSDAEIWCSSGSAKRTSLDVSALDIPFEYWTEHVTFGLLYVMFRLSTRIFYRGVPLRLCNWLSLWCLVLWINQVVCWPPF